MKKTEHKHEEFLTMSHKAGWAFILSFSALIICWCMTIMVIVGQREREFDYSILPDTPSESEYSTAIVPLSLEVPKQVQQLPEARPLEKEDKSNVLSKE